MNYTELQVTSNFSFLRGASHPEELAAHAALLGYKQIAITDRNSFAGIVRAHIAAKKNARMVPTPRSKMLHPLSEIATTSGANHERRLYTRAGQGAGFEGSS